MLEFLPDELTPDQANQVVDLTRNGQLVDMENLPDELTPQQADQLLKQVSIFGMPPKRSTQPGTGASSGSFKGNVGNSINPTNDVPVEGRISQAYGVPVNYEKSGQHGGIDIAIKVGTPVPDRHGGTVLRVEDNPGGYGRSVLVSGSDGITRRYSHLSDFGVKEGDTIPANTVIGLSGDTGNSTGPHLDYREYKN